MMLEEGVNHSSFCYTQHWFFLFSFPARHVKQQPLFWLHLFIFFKLLVLVINLMEYQKTVERFEVAGRKAICLQYHIARIFCQHIIEFQ
jgi:hypothetical protein